MPHETKELRKSPVKEIMTEEFHSVHPEEEINEIIRLFDKYEDECFPVVDDDENFIADIHERDLLKLAISPSILNEHEIIGYLGTKIDESYFAETAEEIMEKHDVTFNPETNVEDCVIEMWKEDLRSVPVLEHGKIKGILFEKDIIEKVVEEKG